MESPVDNDRVSLRLTRDAASVSVSGTPDVLDIPASCARRSALIGDLRDQLDDDTVIVPLPLCWDEVQAWAACALANGATDIGIRALTSSAKGDDAADLDSTLTRGLKAADFFRDDATTAQITATIAQLLTAFTIKPPSPNEQARAGKIVRAMSHSHVLAILAAVYEKTHPARGAPREWRVGNGFLSSHFRPRPQNVSLGPYVGRLLQLLPRSFHPAVVRACCMDPADRQSCDLRVRGSNPDDSMWHIDGEEQLTQLLAAAAPLAGGRLEQGYASASSARDDATGDVGSGGCNLPREQEPRPPSSEPPAHACGELGCGSGAEWRLMAGALTRLQLCVYDWRPKRQSPVADDLYLQNQEATRWCTALAQLRTMRSLAVDVMFGRLVYGMGDLTAALRSLSALTHFRFRCVGCLGVPQDEITRTCDWQLLEGVAWLPKLQCLELDSCFDIAPLTDRARRELESAAGAIRQLPHMSQLTCLRLIKLVIRTDLVHVWADAIRELPALQELCIVLAKCNGSGLIREITEAVAAHGVVLQSLFDGPGFASLSHLEMGVEAGSQYRQMNSSECEALVSHFYQGVCTHSPALLARLTELRLGPGLFGCEPEGGSVAALLADTPALQSLRLNAVSAQSLKPTFRTAGLLSSRDLLSLVPLLPRMTGLTRLDFSFCGADGTSMLAVLTALARPGTPVCGGLLDLDIGCNDFGRQHAELAGLLQQFRSLERLGMQRLCVVDLFGLEGLRVLLPAVACLPRLRALDASQNCSSADKKAAWDLAAGLAHVRDVQL